MMNIIHDKISNKCYVFLPRGEFTSLRINTILKLIDLVNKGIINPKNIVINPSGNEINKIIKQRGK